MRLTNVPTKRKKRGIPMSRNIKLGAHDTAVILRSDGKADLLTATVPSQVGQQGEMLGRILLAVAANPVLRAVVLAILEGEVGVAVAEAPSGDCDNCAPVHTNAPGGDA